MRYCSKFIALILVCVPLVASHAQTSKLAPTFEEAAALYSDENFTAAYEIAVPLATKGDVKAQIMLGEMYEFGRGRNADITNALRWYEMAAAQDHKAAMFRLGILHLTGRAGLPDPSTARKWFEKAAAADHMEASNELGLIYYHGNGVDQNSDKAVRHIRKAAEAGLAQAQYNLGLLYVNGHGVDKDLRTASVWFEKAAVQGLPEAALDYGLMVYGGDAGFRKDYKIGAQWLLVAANAGNAKAQRFVARILAAGRGLKKDRVEAAKYYILARQEGQTDADLDVMMSNLSETQMGEAQRRARIFSEEIRTRRLNAADARIADDG